MNALAKALLWVWIPILGIFLIFHPWREPQGPGLFWIVILPLVMIGATLLNPFWWWFWWALDQRDRARRRGHH